MESSKGDLEHLHALVDMGSNGIRFSISDLSPPTARNLPTVFQHRSAISLYDAQYQGSEKQPIPKETIQLVLSAMSRYKTACEDYHVPKSNIRVLATEATREALNATEFLEAIKSRTGWKVETIPKEEETRIGALGIASGFNQVKGLLIDLGGGSMQISWLQTNAGEVLSPAGSVSLPYGAAALLNRLQNCEKPGHQSVEDLRKEITTIVRKTWKALATSLPSQSYEQGIKLYLSGGGFRGWGYLLLSLQSRDHQYPISSIGGFKAEGQSFLATNVVLPHAESGQGDTFRVSKRRVTQVPAVALLVECLQEALPDIQEVWFAQGGVREGALFDSLTTTVRAENPLETATRGPKHASNSKLVKLLADGVSASCPACVLSTFKALTNGCFYHGCFPKDIRAGSALRSTTTGVWAHSYGLTHVERATIGLLLCERWGGEVPPGDETFLTQLQSIMGPEAAWWCRFTGRVLALITEVYPSGEVGDSERVRMSGTFDSNSRDLNLKVSFPQINFDAKQAFAAEIDEIEKVGKKKHWIGGKSGWGIPVHLTIEE